MTDGTLITTETTAKPETTTESLISGEATVVPTEFVADPAKSAEENATAKTAFDKAIVDKAASDKVAAETKATADAKVLANDTKATPFKVEEIKLPEGMEVDPALATDFTALVNKFGLQRDAVAELTALQAKAMQDVSEKGNALWSDMQENWKKDFNADPEFGGPKAKESLASVSKFVQKYAGKDIEEVKAALNLTGAGNNPFIIRMMARAAKDFNEPGFVSGQPTSVPGDAASILYPNQGKS